MSCLRYVTKSIVAMRVEQTAPVAAFGYARDPNGNLQSGSAEGRGNPKRWLVLLV